VAAAFEPASRSTRSVAPGGRIGAGPVQLSDQVTIDGARSSSTREWSGEAKTLGFHLGVAGAHRGHAGQQGWSGGSCVGSLWSCLAAGEAEGPRAMAWSRKSCRCSRSARQWRHAPRDLAKMESRVRLGRTCSFQRIWSGERTRRR
jgi:hypothetical protein